MAKYSNYKSRAKGQEEKSESDVADLGYMYYFLRGKSFKVFSGKGNLLCPSPLINILIL